MDWYLQDIHGGLHKALFIELINHADTQMMSWERRLSWSRELTYSRSDGRKVYKLMDTVTRTIQGGISMSDADDHVFVHLIESATHNRTDPRHFTNVACLLIAFAGKYSIDLGADGFLALEPKSDLINYYAQRFQAFQLPGRKMGISGPVTKHWISVYYK